MALSKKLIDFSNALKRLEEAHDKAFEARGGENYSFFRDSTIQRFEFTLEIAWKSVKSFLLEHEGVECRSPKGCMREFSATGYIDADETVRLLQMIDDRNLASHTYHENIAEEIFKNIQSYQEILKKIYEIMKSSEKSSVKAVWQFTAKR